MVTPVLKDKILEFLILNAPAMRYNAYLPDFAPQFGTNESVVDAVIEQFAKRGFLTYEGTAEGNRFIYLTVDAHDYVLKGGHMGEFENLEKQAAKLEKELESLRPIAPMETFNNMKGIIDTLLSTASTYKAFAS